MSGEDSLEDESDDREGLDTSGDTEGLCVGSLTISGDSEKRFTLLSSSSEEELDFRFRQVFVVPLSEDSVDDVLFLDEHEGPSEFCGNEFDLFRNFGRVFDVGFCHLDWGSG